MILNEAVKYFKRAVPNRKIYNSAEYPSYFMFSTSKPSTDITKIEVGTTYLVSKSDGKVTVFNPSIFPVEEAPKRKELDYNES